MPATTLVYFKDKDGSAPVLEWLTDLSRHDKAAYAKCKVRISVLGTSGHELKRPVSAPLIGGVHELRVRHGNINYRVLYFFHGRNVAVLAHGCTKEREVPEVEISRALERKDAFSADPNKYTYVEEH